MNNIIENICPYCNKHLLINKKSFANHVRWCKSNPRYLEILKSTKEKISKKSKEQHANKYGEYIEFKTLCSSCGKEIIVKIRNTEENKNKKYFCSVSCKNKHVLNDNQKQNIKNGVKKYFLSKNPNYIFKKEIKNICPICGKEYFGTSQTCSLSCGTKYRYLKPLLELYSNKNIIDIKEIKKIYKNSCKFQFSLNEYFNEFNFDLIKDNGWYKPYNHGNNLNGISRDHKYSCNKGFLNLIDPYILSHPANCQLMCHTDNISKLDKCSISLEDLIKDIQIWNNKYGKYPNKINYYLFDKFNIKFNIYFDK